MIFFMLGMDKFRGVRMSASARRGHGPVKEADRR